MKQKRDMKKSSAEVAGVKETIRASNDGMTKVEKQTIHGDNDEGGR